MRRIELLVVQLEEAKRLIELNSVPHLRLAFILLDNATELIMQWMINDARLYNGLRERLLEVYARIGAAADDDMLAYREVLERTVVRKAKREKLEKYFEEKVRFLIGRQHLQAELGPILKRLHHYRNDAYHRNKIRLGTIRTATYLYFDIACTVFMDYMPSTIVYDSGPGESPTLVRYIDHAELRDPSTIPSIVGGVLKESLGLDSESSTPALAAHLTARLSEVDEALAYIRESLDDSPSTDLIIRMVQLDDLPLSDIGRRVAGNLLSILSERYFPVAARS